VFVGIAPTDDVTGFLDGAGYATIEHLETADLTTHEGPELTTPPSEESIWAASTEGSGEQTLLWDTRDGDWSIVLMNADAGAGVAVTGDVSARFPLLPWLAGGFLLAGAALAVLGGWLLVLGIRRETRASQLASGPQPTAVQKEVAQ
jgi:hypothetical protein